MIWERSVAQARASVMIYNNDLKKWEYAGGTQGVSQVNLYFNPNPESYRIVGRKISDKEVVINCNIAKNLKYNKATATFHQWRDQRQVYGLNFQTPDDASTFSTAVLGAVDKLCNPSDPPPQAAPQHNGYDGHAGSQYQKFQEDPNRKLREMQEAQRSQQQQPSATITVTSTREPLKPAAPVPAAPPTPPVLSAVPPTTPAPPPVPAAPPMPPGGGPPPPPPPPPIGGTGPPAPPPPPVGGASGGGGSGGGGGGGLGGAGGLANALKGVQLKKRSESTEEKRPPPMNADPMGDMMSALNKKLQSRKKMVESESGESPPKSSTPTIVKASVPPPTVNKTSTLNKPTNFVAPTSKNNTSTLGRGNSISSSSSTVSSDELKTVKEEILKTVREEIEQAKTDIISALREEIRKLST